MQDLTARGTQTLLRAARTAPRVQPKDEESIVKRVGDKALGGISAVGNLLDLPGSTVRDVLSLRNPLDQWMTPFSPDNRITGREMLRGVGLIGKEDTWSNFAPSMALEIGLDPLTYLTFGASALGKGGKAAHALGLIDKATLTATGRESVKRFGKLAGTTTEVLHQVGPREARITTSLNEVLNTLPGKAPTVTRSASEKVTALRKLEEYAKKHGFSGRKEFLAKHGSEPLGGFAGATIPFSGQVTPIGTGTGSQLLARSLDTAGRAIGESVPGRTAKMLFSSIHGGEFDKNKQNVFGLYSKSLKASQQQARLDLYGHLQDVNGIADHIATTFGHNSQEAQEINGLRNELWELMRATTETAGHGAPDFSKALAVRPQSNLGQQMASLGSQFGVKNAHVSLVENAAQRIVDTFDRLHSEIQQMGGGSRWIEPTEHSSWTTRSVSAKTFGGKMGVWREWLNRRKILQMKHSGMESRQVLTKTIPRDAIEDILHNYQGQLKTKADKTIHSAATSKGLELSDVRDIIANHQGDADGILNKYAPKMRDAAGDPLDPQAALGLSQVLSALPESVSGIISKHGHFLNSDDIVRHATDLSTYKRSLPKELQNRLTMGGDLYDPFPVSASRYVAGAAKVKAAHSTVLDLFSKTATNKAMTPEDAMQSIININSNFVPTPAEAMEIGQPLIRRELNPATGKLEVAGGALRDAGIDNPEAAVKYMADRMGVSPDKIEDLIVPQRHISAANSLMQTMSKGEEYEHVIGQAWKEATQVIKNHLTIMWPAFHARNAVSGWLGMNTLANVIHTPADAKAYGQGTKLSSDLIKHPEKYPQRLAEIFALDASHFGFGTHDVSLQGLSKSLGELPTNPLDVKASFAQAQKEIGETPLGMPLAPHEQMMLQSLPGDVGSLMSQGKYADALKTVAAHKDLIKETVLDKFGQAVQKPREILRTAQLTGEKTSAYVEWINRISLYNYLRDHLGWSPEQAARKVGEAHTTYYDIAPFERKYAKQAIPFYTFARKQLENTVRTIAERPGGPLAATIKTLNRSRRPDELTPDYVAETASIPLGTLPDGSNRYLTGLGAHFEDPLSFFGKGIRGAGLELLSRLNPMIKGPLEYSTGQVFFQSTPEGGRAMGDADPLLGRTLANITGREEPYRLPQLLESAVANSPASRYLSTARQLTDVRKNPLTKAANLLTGLRISDISPAAQDAILRERVSHALKESGGRAFVRTYLPESAQNAMNPQQLDEARQLQAMLNTLADRAKQRKKAKQSNGST